MRHNQDHDVHFHFHLDGNININAGSDNSEVLDAIHELQDMLDHTAELQAQLDAAKADEAAAIEGLSQIAPEQQP